MASRKSDDQYSDEEIARRYEATLKSVLATPPQDELPPAALAAEASLLVVDPTRQFAEEALQGCPPTPPSDPWRGIADHQLLSLSTLDGAKVAFAT